MKRANCLGKAPNVRLNPDALDPWFPGRGQSQQPGKIACFVCPVKAECADYRDRTHATYGMWAAQIIKRDKEEDADNE